MNDSLRLAEGLELLARVRAYPGVDEAAVKAAHGLLLAELNRSLRALTQEPSVPPAVTGAPPPVVPQAEHDAVVASLQDGQRVIVEELEKARAEIAALKSAPPAEPPAAPPAIPVVPAASTP